MDYVYSVLSDSDGENPLDYPAFFCNSMEFFVVATEAQTGNTVYFSKQDILQDDYSVLKALCAIPFVCYPYPVKDTLYFDGALGDPVPIPKAFELGCDRVVVFLTRPEDEIRISDSDEKLARLIQHRYPIAAEKLRRRAENYNTGVVFVQKYVKSGKALIVAPDDTYGVSTLTRDVNKLDWLCRKGYKTANE